MIIVHLTESNGGLLPFYDYVTCRLSALTTLSLGPAAAPMRDTEYETNFTIWQ